MLSRLTSYPIPSNANDMTALLDGLQSCLAMADKLDLSRVAIHIDEARCWLLENGCDDRALPCAAPKSFSPSGAIPLS